jgi:hypothetical protein
MIPLPASPLYSVVCTDERQNMTRTDPSNMRAILICSKVITVSRVLLSQGPL